MGFPISRSDLVSVLLVENLARIAWDTRPRVMGESFVHHETIGVQGQATAQEPGRPIPLPRVSHIRVYLRQELEAAYNLISDPNSRGTGLANIPFIDALAATLGQGGFEGNKNQQPDSQQPISHEADEFARMYPQLMEELPGNPKQRMLWGPLLGDRGRVGPARPADPEGGRAYLAAGHQPGGGDIDTLRFHSPRPDPATTGRFRGLRYRGAGP